MCDSKPQWNKLPHEIWLRILSYLPISSLASVSSSCKMLNSVCHLRYRQLTQLPESFTLSDHRKLKDILPRLNSLRIIPRYIARLLHHKEEVRDVITTSCANITTVHKPSSVSNLLELVEEGMYHNHLSFVQLDAISHIRELNSLVKLVSLCPKLHLDIEWSKTLATHQPATVLSRIQFLHWRDLSGMNEVSLHLAVVMMKSLTGLSLTALFEWEVRLMRILLSVLSEQLVQLRITCSSKLLGEVSTLKRLKSLSWIMPNDDSKPQQVMLSLCQFLASSGSSLTNLEIIGCVYSNHKSFKQEHESRVLLLSAIHNNCPKIRRLEVSNLFFSLLKVDMYRIHLKPWTNASLQPLRPLLLPNTQRFKLFIPLTRSFTESWLKQLEGTCIHLTLL